MERTVTVNGPRQKLTADDLEVGHVYQVGKYTPTRDEIVAFGKAWDPQTFHIDVEASKQGIFGDVIASGVHTLGIFQRLAVDSLYHRLDILAGRRLRLIQFHRPILPGKTLTGRVAVGAIDRSADDRSLVTLHGALADAEGRDVFTVEVEVYVWRRGCRSKRRTPEAVVQKLTHEVSEVAGQPSDLGPGQVGDAEHAGTKRDQASQRRVIPG